jgi:hypothetical protein
MLIWEPCGSAFGGGEVVSWWVFWRANFLSGRYDDVIGTEKSGTKELSDPLENEPERAYRAFESFLALPVNERTLLEAYRGHVGNPNADVTCR